MVEVEKVAELGAFTVPAVVERVPGKVHGCAGVDDGGQNAVRDAPSLGGLQYSQLTP